MSDITKCKGTGCPIKENCYRFTTKEHDISQSWFTEIPGKWTEEDGAPTFDCEMFWGEQSEFIMNKLNLIVDGKIS